MTKTTPKTWNGLRVRKHKDIWTNVAGERGGGGEAVVTDDMRQGASEIVRKVFGGNARPLDLQGDYSATFKIKTIEPSALPPWLAWESSAAMTSAAQKAAFLKFSAPTVGRHEAGMLRHVRATKPLAACGTVFDARRHVPELYATGTAGGWFVMITEFVDGTPGYKTPREAAMVVHAVQALLAAGVAHNDLHMNNIRIARGARRAVLLDLGFATVLRNPEDVRRTLCIRKGWLGDLHRALHPQAARAQARFGREGYFPNAKVLAMARFTASRRPPPRTLEAELLRVPGDGNCLFNAVALDVQIESGGKPTPTPADLRRAAVAWWCSGGGRSDAQMKQVLRALYGSVERYCGVMARDGTYGDEPELKALAAVLRRPIQTYVAAGGSPARRFHVYGYTHGSEFAASAPPVLLRYVPDRQHYDLLRIPVSTSGFI
jgi:hypothetical protein